MRDGPMSGGLSAYECLEAQLTEVDVLQSIYSHVETVPGSHLAELQAVLATATTDSSLHRVRCCRCRCLPAGPSVRDVTGMCIVSCDRGSPCHWSCCLMRRRQELRSLCVPFPRRTRMRCQASACGAMKCPRLSHGEPVAACRCTHWAANSARQLVGRSINERLCEHIKDCFEPGDCVLFEASHFAQEAVADARSTITPKADDKEPAAAAAAPGADCTGGHTPDGEYGTRYDDEECKGNDTGPRGDVEVREWIYFHHVYSSSKRKSMVKWAAELAVSGFVMVGKPGLAMVEGPKAAVREWHARVASMNWQRMQQKMREVRPAAGTAVAHYIGGFTPPPQPRAGV